MINKLTIKETEYSKLRRLEAIKRFEEIKLENKFNKTACAKFDEIIKDLTIPELTPVCIAVRKVISDRRNKTKNKNLYAYNFQ